MNAIGTIEFAQLLASRICHDLISPVAAVNNGLELLLEENDDDIDSRKRALELIDESAKMAAIKLKLMRAAFGAGQVLSDNCSKNDLLSLSQPIAEKNKIDILWDNPSNRRFNLTEARVILNLMLIMMESLPRGGHIELNTDDSIKCTVNSQKLIFSTEKVAYLSDTQPIPSEPRYIGFMLLKMLTEKQNFYVNKTDNQLTIKISA